MTTTTTYPTAAGQVLAGDRILTAFDGVREVAPDGVAVADGIVYVEFTDGGEGTDGGSPVEQYAPGYLVDVVRDAPAGRCGHELCAPFGGTCLRDGREY